MTGALSQVAARTEVLLVVCLALTLAHRKHSNNRWPLGVLFIPSEVGKVNHTSLTQSTVLCTPAPTPQGGDRVWEGKIPAAGPLLVPP